MEAGYLYNPVYVYPVYEDFLKFNFPTCRLFDGIEEDAIGGPATGTTTLFPKVVPRIIYDLYAILHMCSQPPLPRGMKIDNALLNTDDVNRTILEWAARPDYQQLTDEINAVILESTAVGYDDMMSELDTQYANALVRYEERTLERANAARARIKASEHSSAGDTARPWPEDVYKGQRLDLPNAVAHIYYIYTFFPLLRKILAIETQVSTRRVFVLYRGDQRQGDKAFDFKDQNALYAIDATLYDKEGVPRSVSFNTSVLNAFFHDWYACTLKYMLLPEDGAESESVQGMPFSRVYATLPATVRVDLSETGFDDVVFVPPLPAPMQILGEGELFHARSKVYRVTPTVIGMYESGEKVPFLQSTIRDKDEFQRRIDRLFESSFASFFGGGERNFKSLLFTAIAGIMLLAVTAVASVVGGLP
jgi:hypothetical protein